MSYLFFCKPFLLLPFRALSRPPNDVVVGLGRCSYQPGAVLVLPILFTLDKEIELRPEIELPLKSPSHDPQNMKISV